MAERSYGQYCGVTTAVELIGERWALLIVRDLLVGARRYTDLKNGLPRIPTNILSSRLKELQAAGIIRRVPLPHGLAYELTTYGRGLEDIVLALGRWGAKAMDAPNPEEILTPDSMTIALRSAYRPEKAIKLPATIYDTHFADFALRVRVEGRGLRVQPLVAQDGSPAVRLPRLSFTTGPDIRGLFNGDLASGPARARARVTLLEGDEALFGRFAETFRL